MIGAIKKPTKRITKRRKQPKKPKKERTPKKALAQKAVRLSYSQIVKKD